MRKTKIILSASLFAGFVVVLAWAWNRSPERRWGVFRNEEAFCYNCSSFLLRAMQDYSDDHDGWYPQGGATSLDSLVVLIKDYGLTVKLLTCHAFIDELNRHFEAHHEIASEFCCYRYNEGLQKEDPDDLIVLYYFRPTRWESWNRKGQKYGRQILSTSVWRWEFIPETEFQERQARTERFLKERARRAAETGAVTSNLVLTVTCANLATNSFHLSARLENVGTNAATVVLLEPGKLIHREDHSGGSYFLEAAKAQFILAPGQTRSFPGWYEITVEDRFVDGKLFSRSTQSKSTSGFSKPDGTPSINSGSGYSGFGPGADVSNVNAGSRVQASLRANVSMGNVRDLTIVLKSKEFKYLEPRDKPSEGPAR